ncbi:meiotic nuclear division protein 1 homolog isoform X2 [Amia ocellicauda]|uniref:meiotic nuclear division protein 1 homolog isoform X2 n=1 Tax=Amia ocellicauda TaxID=2972642 RepID=UPI0034648BDB
MSKKKGLSLEEKRTRMMEIFFETKDVFQLKDIEKIAPKTKGITPMSVKDVLQSLVDDSMVDSERVGTSNYYWAFPSKALHSRKRRQEELQQQGDRAALLTQLQALREERLQLSAELDKYRECDPAVVEQIREFNKTAKDSANRWTDNVFSIKAWARQKFGFEDRRLDKTFGIAEDFDYVE